MELRIVCMKKVGVIGHLGLGLDLLNGQTIKTKIVTKELENKFGSEEVLKVDTHGGLASYLLLPFVILKALLLCQNVIILPAQNGIKIIAPLLYVMNLFFRKKIHYVVIGGWMPKLIKDRNFLKFSLKHFDCIFVETSVMKNDLEKMQFKNVVIMQNSKPLNILPKTELDFSEIKSFKFCIFSRIMKQKGIEHAVFAIKEMNKIFGENFCCLDIYGQIEKAENEWFDLLKQSFPTNVAYKGVVPFNESVDVLKEYTVLLFPTLFFTEGVPGTIIDAYAAGLPVVSSKWASFSDIIDDGKTGVGYEFGSEEQLCETLKNLMSVPENVLKMKENCIDKAQQFLPCNAMNVLFDELS